MRRIQCTNNIIVRSIVNSDLIFSSLLWLNWRQRLFYVPIIIIIVGESGGHWDTGSIGTPPLIENPQHTEHARCNILDAQEPPLHRSIRTKKIVQYKRVGE